jgi:hypothetical protein
MARSFDEFLAMLDPVTAQAVGGFYGGQGSNYGGQGSNYVNPYRYSHLSPEDMPGDKLYSDLIRAQLNDYLTRFQPVEDFLVGQINETGTGQLDADLARTREAVLGGRQNVTGQQARARERYGLSATPVNAGRSNSTVGTLVGGLNMTRQRDSERRNALLVGGLGEVGAKARSTG